MKAIFTLLCILSFAITSAQNFDAGLTGGFCTSQVSGDNLSGYNKLGSRFGAYISYPINKKMSYQLEMQHLQKGSKKPYTENSPVGGEFALDVCCHDNSITNTWNIQTNAIPDAFAMITNPKGWTMKSQNFDVDIPKLIRHLD